MTAPKQAEIDPLVEQTKQHLLAALADGGWRPVNALQACLPDELAEARLQQVLNPHVATKGLDDPREYARYLLVQDAVAALAEDEAIRRRTTDSGRVEVRLDPASVTETVQHQASAIESVTPALATATATSPVVEAPEASPANAVERPPDAVESELDGTLSATMPATAAADAQPCQVSAESFGHAAVRLVEPDLPIHKLAALLPETPPADFEKIKQDMRINGQRVAAWTHEGQLLDGRTRQTCAKELGLQLAVQEWQGPGSPLAFVIALNLHRRHLTESQRALIAAKLKPMFEAEARQRMRTRAAAEPVANLPQGKSRDQAADNMKVSGRSVQTACKVIKEGAPELIRAVEQGTVSVAAAADLTELSPEVQQQTLKRGKQAVKTQVKQLRQRQAAQRQRGQEHK